MELKVRITANMLDVLWKLQVAQDEASRIVEEIDDLSYDYSNCPCCENYDYDDNLIE